MMPEFVGTELQPLVNQRACDSLFPAIPMNLTVPGFVGESLKKNSTWATKQNVQDGGFMHQHLPAIHKKLAVQQANECVLFSVFKIRVLESDLTKLTVFWSF